jgi:hypothetical protein
MGGRKRLLKSLIVFALLVLSALVITSAVTATEDDWDNDGVSNDTEEALDTDPDDPNEYPDIDSDGDGYSDHDEYVEGTDADNDTSRPLGEYDSDGDGFTDRYEDRKKTDPYDARDYPKVAGTSGGDDGRDNLVTVFAMTLILTFAVFIIAAGAFTSYFGAGKSRGIGGGLLGMGLVILILSYYIKKVTDEQTLLSLITWDVSIVQLMVTVIGAGVGFLAAIVLFLVAIMKS